MLRDIVNSSELLFTTTRIDTINEDGSEGSGTGFFFGFNVDGKIIPVVITNKHVVEGSRRGSFCVHLANQTGDVEDVNVSFDSDNFETLWFKHENPDVDLCMMPVLYLSKRKNANIHFFFKVFTEDQIPNSSQLEKLTPVEDLFAIGYPKGMIDAVNNMPIIRKGITATHPALDFNGNSEFLIDMAVFPGSSGSPVIIYNQGGYAVDNGIALGKRLLFLGVLARMDFMSSDGIITESKIPLKRATSNIIPINIGYVIKSKQILDLKRFLIGLYEKEDYDKYF